MSRKQKDAAVAQSVVRRIGSAEVTGPIPVFFIGCLRFHSQTSDSHFLSFHIFI